MKRINAYLDGEMLFSTGYVLVVSLIIMSCLGCANMNPVQGSIGFPRLIYGDHVGRITGRDFYCYGVMAVTNQLEICASIDKLLVHNKKQYLIVIESVASGGEGGRLVYEWAIITNCHDNNVARSPLYKDGITCVQKETFNLIFEQIAEAPQINIIPEPKVCERNYYVTLSVYNGEGWKQVRAIYPWAVFQLGHILSETDEETIETENVAMRITFALLAAFKVNGISDRLETTYANIKYAIQNYEFHELVKQKKVKCGCDAEYGLETAEGSLIPERKSRGK